ncbi:MAG: hypothetical protein JXQ73_19565 [Phycisphaerae bacterium]|nr:hypothetical protein [Phycisphaerae bacterium]
MTTGPVDAAVCLEGSPRSVGKAFGQANAATIRAQVQGFRGQGKQRDDALRATEQYRSLVERLAPHWLEEAAGLAGAAGVGAEEYLAYQGAKYRGINRGDCFTYFSAPRHNFGGVTLFHKNRDNKDRPQAAYVKGIKVPGRSILRFAATGDTSDMGTMMGLNEKGLAAAADTGAPDPNPRFRGMMNPDTMRLILEQASDVDEAYRMLEQQNAERIYAGGKIATNWMFADARGRAMRVVQCHESLEKTSDEEGLLVMRPRDARGHLVLDRLGSAKGEITPQLMNSLSRTPPVLHKTNISAMTAVIPPWQTGLFGYAQFAVFAAGRTLYVPIYVGVTATPRVLLDGTLYGLSTVQAEGFGLASEAFEANLDAERARIEVRARAAFEKSGSEAARGILTEGSLDLASRVCGQMKAG